MKNLFVILITYTKPFSEVEKVLPKHRAFLQEGYANQNLLASGPNPTKTGGIVVGSFNTRDEALEFFKNDPYAKDSVATHEILEFTPVLHSDFLKTFLN